LGIESLTIKITAATKEDKKTFKDGDRFRTAYLTTFMDGALDGKSLLCSPGCSLQTIINFFAKEKTKKSLDNHCALLFFKASIHKEQVINRILNRVF
jgi:hypothetical protein